MLAEARVRIFRIQGIDQQRVPRLNRADLRIEKGRTCHLGVAYRGSCAGLLGEMFEIGGKRVTHYQVKRGQARRVRTVLGGTIIDAC